MGGSVGSGLLLREPRCGSLPGPMQRRYPANRRRGETRRVKVLRGPPSGFVVSRQPKGKASVFVLFPFLVRARFGQ